VSSDGRGPYIEGTDGAWFSGVDIGTGLGLRQLDAIPFWNMAPAKGVEKPRRITVNLNDPVPGGGGVALGTVDGYHLLTQWQMVGSAFQNVHTMKIGERSTVAQMNVGFSINGRQHLLQMGPQPNGHCHDSTVIHGAGTSSATIHRASETKWAVDLPAGSVGRLFDVDDLHAHAIDKGLYHIRIHYEVGK